MITSRYFGYVIVISGSLEYVNVIGEVTCRSKNPRVHLLKITFLSRTELESNSNGTSKLLSEIEFSTFHTTAESFFPPYLTIVKLHGCS